MKKNILIINRTLILLLILILLLYYYLKKNNEALTINKNNSIGSSIKETLNQVFNPIIRSFRIMYNSQYKIVHNFIKKINYHY
jgi:hypothetical protein